jgi:hypothetical protein
MTSLPSFYCTRTLMSYSPRPDLNRVTLCGPDGFEFTMYQMGATRHAGANQRCNELAAALTELWDNKKAAPKGG